jgi:superfamily II DNA/RNA helicase
MPTSKPSSDLAFKDLGLSDALLKALADVGYESPSLKR